MLMLLIERALKRAYAICRDDAAARCHGMLRERNKAAYAIFRAMLAVACCFFAIEAGVRR